MQIERLQLHPNVVNCYTTYLHPSSALANKYRIINMGGMKYIGALTHLVSGLSYNLNMSAYVKVIVILESSPNWSANLPNSFNPDLRVSDRKIGNQLESLYLRHPQMFHISIDQQTFGDMTQSITISIMSFEQAEFCDVGIYPAWN